MPDNLLTLGFLLSLQHNLAHYKTAELGVKQAGWICRFTTPYNERVFRRSHRRSQEMSHAYL